MQLLTDGERYRRMSGDLTRADWYDIVLDDVTLLRDVAVLDDWAVGLLAGPQTGFLPLAGVPQLAARQVRHGLRLRRRHRLPWLGRLLRARWARRMFARLGPPPWLPKL